MLEVCFLLLCAIAMRMEASEEPLKNAWSVDRGGEAGGGELYYVYEPTPEQIHAATNQGFRFTAVCRMVDDYGDRGRMGVSFGTGAHRFTMVWDFNDELELTTGLHDGSTYPVSKADREHDGFHTHELVYDPALGQVAYYYDGQQAPLSNLNPSLNHSGQIRWGGIGEGLRSHMHFHLVEFEIEGMGVIASYNAGTEGNPEEAPDPLGQGWIKRDDWTMDGGKPVSPDYGEIRSGVLTRGVEAFGQTNATLLGYVLPRGTSTSMWFEWGREGVYDAVTPVVDAGSSNDWVPHTAMVQGLEIGEFYQYRIAASNEFGINYGNKRTFATDSFRSHTNEVTFVVSGTMALGDADNDDDLDIFFMVRNAGNHLGQLYFNDGLGNFQLADIPLLGGTGLSAWGDYNNDDYLDLAVIASDGSYLYRNERGTNLVSDLEVPAGGIHHAAWGDADNDGDLDLLAALLDNTQGRALDVFLNQPDHFERGHLTIPSSIGGYEDTFWADFDLDQDLDIYLMGGSFVGIYFNGGQLEFLPRSESVGQPSRQRSTLGDLDQDGDLDLVVLGNRESLIYRNDGGTNLVNVPTDLPVLWHSVIVAGDYDNDGDLDLFISGSFQSTPVTKVFRNEGGFRFVDMHSDLLGMECFPRGLSLGDLDQDGDLDLITSGSNEAQGLQTKVYLNQVSQLSHSNQPPSAPTGLTAQRIGERILFSWDAAYDAETPSQSLTYNLAVGTTPEMHDIVSPMSDITTGFRRIPQMGNVQHNTSWWLYYPEEVPIYWSVQAVDAGYRGGCFASTRTFPPINMGMKLSIERGESQADLVIAAMPGQTVKLQSSSNLVHWDLLSTLTTGGDGMAAFADPLSDGRSRRFYRLMRP